MFLPFREKCDQLPKKSEEPSYICFKIFAWSKDLVGHLGQHQAAPCLIVPNMSLFGRERKQKMKSFLITIFAMILLLNPTATGKIEIICVGDSITAGSKASNRHLTSYPAVLQSLLGDTFQVYNYGDGGTLAQKQVTGASKYKTQKPYWESPHYTRALNHTTADIVVIQLGTNDAFVPNWNETGFIIDYTQLINSFRTVALPKTKIYISIPPPCSEDLEDMNTTVLNHRLAHLINKIAAMTNTKVIDVSGAFKRISNQVKSFVKRKDRAYSKNSTTSRSSVMIDHNVTKYLQLDSLSFDGLHPNDKGYTILAKAVRDRLLAKKERKKAFF